LNLACIERVINHVEEFISVGNKLENYVIKTHTYKKRFINISRDICGANDLFLTHLLPSSFCIRPLPSHATIDFSLTTTLIETNLEHRFNFTYITSLRASPRNTTQTHKMKKDVGRWMQVVGLWALERKHLVRRTFQISFTFLNLCAHIFACVCVCVCISS
jgi:hypothetical protein